jgi:hypothetical protein
MAEHHDLEFLELARAQPQCRHRERTRNSKYSNDTTKMQPPPPESEDANPTAAS